MPSVYAQGQLIAESDNTVVVEGNHYLYAAALPAFPAPPDSFNKEYFKPAASQLTTHCPWKGDASYYDIVVGDGLIPDAAWYYPKTFDKAKSIEGSVAFYKNKVEVKE
ncbi:hypothetical protein JCM8547_007250 [Rhodosporidiobolus lusitaniae]